MTVDFYFMALTRQQKEARVTQVSIDLKAATSVVFVAYNGLTVDELEELRDQLFTSQSRLQVVPKRLLKLALKEAAVDFDPSTQVGQLAIIWGSDPVAPAKVLHTFARKNDKARLVAGVLEGVALSQEQVTALALLPSHEQLLSQLVSVLSGPARGLAQVFSGVPRSFVYALRAIGDKKS